MAITAEQVILAINGDLEKGEDNSWGNTVVIADRLGCDRSYVYKLLKKFATARTAFEEAREQGLDETERELKKLIEAGNTRAILFKLKTQGRKRGYGERLEVDISPELRALLDRFAELGIDPKSVFVKMMDKLDGAERIETD